MFVILGLSGGKPEISTSSEYMLCTHCNNQRYWNLIHERTNFSLFFLPVFPVNDKYYFACPICNNGRQLSKNEYTNLKNKA